MLLQAMGFTGAAFERVPGQAMAPYVPCGEHSLTANAPNSYLDLHVGYDFHWQAADGSTIQAHWLSGTNSGNSWAGGYIAGNSAFGSSNPVQGGLEIDNGPTGIQDLITWCTAQANPGVPYLFAPIDSDFTPPYVNLQSVIHAWNEAPAVPVTVRLATFDHFMSLVASSGSMPLQKLTTSAASTYPFIPHPYYSGCYGSRPKLKRLHYAAVRKLLFAESMQLVLQAQGVTHHQDAITKAWHLVAPSTHHDYITGTSPNGSTDRGGCGGEDVYGIEQVPRLEASVLAADAVKDDILERIASMQSPTGQDSSVPVLVFNSVGFERTGIAHLKHVPPGGPFLSSTTDHVSYHPVQSDGNGGLYLLVDEVPSMGYRTVFLSTGAWNVDTELFVRQSPDEGATMSNGRITAQIGVAGLYGLTHAIDPGWNCIGSDPSCLALYEDYGNLYRFGMEVVCSGPVPFQDSGATVDGTWSLVTTERDRLLAKSVLAWNGYTITYELFATDTAVRVTIEGAAASYQSVMARVPFKGTPASLAYGTTSHWDQQSPRNFFTIPQPLTFEPTHEYVAPVDTNGNILGAIYHYATPGWAIDPFGGILGCILRNTPQEQAVCGTDPDSHNVSFAIAPPAGLRMPGNGAATEGSMLMAALDVNNPLEAVAVPATAERKLDRIVRITQAMDPGAIVTVAKAGTHDPSKMILRVYQPTNRKIDQTVVKVDPTIAALYRNGENLAAEAVTAIEEASTVDLRITTEASSVTLNLPYAITTIALGTVALQR